eukprot:PhF_6_TR33986/c0_g1_i1/m.49773
MSSSCLKQSFIRSHVYTQHLHNCEKRLLQEIEETSYFYPSKYSSSLPSTVSSSFTESKSPSCEIQIVEPTTTSSAVDTSNNSTTGGGSGCDLCPRAQIPVPYSPVIGFSS